MLAVQNGKTVLQDVLATKTSINFCFVLIATSLLFRLFIIGKYDLMVEEAYYWNYTQHLDFGYLDHPPMVALLIKLSTMIWGVSEFGVRITALFGWVLTAWFSYKLTQLINPRAGQYAVLLLSILPFFFLESLIITPDQPLIVCWAGALYCLYRSLVLNQANYWYLAGMWMGLGLLSKYSIVLVGLATLVYMCLVPTGRHWFKRKEPYLAAVITLVFFTPVIYWNATHEWASFLFQSSHRLNAPRHFTLHLFLGLLVAFLMPLGIVGLVNLFRRQPLVDAAIPVNGQRFLQLFTLVPLVVFGIFSCSHTLKINWIGAGLLAVIPWLAIQLANYKTTRKIWLVSSVFILVSYASALAVLAYDTHALVQPKHLAKIISWNNLSKQFNDVASRVAAQTHSTPVLVPLDLYNVASELTFYQAQLLMRDEIDQSYPVIGGHILGLDNLMFRYWSQRQDFIGKTLILITANQVDFADPAIQNQIIDQTPVATIWSQSQGQGKATNPYYYKVVTLKP